MAAVQFFSSCRCRALSIFRLRHSSRAEHRHIRKESLIRTYSRYSLHGAIRIHKNHDLYSFYPCMFTYLQHRFSTNVSIIWKIKKKKMIGLGGMVNVLNKLTKNQCLIHVFVLRNLSC